MWKNNNKLLLLILSSDSTQSLFRQSNRYHGHFPAKLITANILVMVNIQQKKGRLSLIPHTLLSAHISLEKAKPTAPAYNPLTLAWVPPCWPLSNTSIFINNNAVMTIIMISGHSTSSLYKIIIKTWKLTINSKCIFHLYTLWGLK